VDIQTILQHIAKGNRQAFAPLVEQYQRPLFSYLGRMGFSPAQAEDLAQETFIRAWQHLGQYDAHRAEFSTWLFTIARRLALNELERAGNRLETHWGEDPPDVASHDATPLEHTEQHEQQRRVQAALKRLPLQERSLLALAYSQGLDMQAIAHIEGCSVGAVKTRLHRAREQLRQWLGA
jgi:RNA polymerase sigma-70 factor (ECF subfamily)